MALYSAITINDVSKQLALNIRNNSDKSVAINKIEVYEKGVIATTYTKDKLIDNKIATDINSYGNLGMSISYKTGIWLYNNYIKYYIECNGHLYECKIDVN
mgnify:CR=1 FL=1